MPRHVCRAILVVYKTTFRYFYIAYMYKRIASFMRSSTSTINTVVSCASLVSDEILPARGPRPPANGAMQCARKTPIKTTVSGNRPHCTSDCGTDRRSDRLTVLPRYAVNGVKLYLDECDT